MADEGATLDFLWERLAEAVTAAAGGGGPERETLFLAKLALLLARELGDPARVETLVAVALRDLE